MNETNLASPLLIDFYLQFFAVLNNAAINNFVHNMSFHMCHLEDKFLEVHLLG